MSRLTHQLDRLERDSGVLDGCSHCLGKDVENVWVDYLGGGPLGEPSKPKPGPVLCPHCGRDRLRLTVVRVEYVQMPVG